MDILRAAVVRISPSRTTTGLSDGLLVPFTVDLMSNEIHNWAVIAAAMEKQGATDSQMYRRAKAMANGSIDPMPTSYPAAPYSISVA